MRAQMHAGSEGLARGPVNDEWARIDPIVFVAEARRLQARAMGEAFSAGGRALRSGLTGLAALVRRRSEPLARWSERRRAIGRLAELDDRLLADIGLRRGDIELAVDGLLADPRVTRRTSSAPDPVRDPLVEGVRRPAKAGSANPNRPAATALQEGVRDRAA